MKMKIYAISILLLLIASLSSASVSKVDVLSLPDISDWEKQEFSGVTSYQLVNVDNRQALKAVSKQSASGLVREIEVDLNKTPYINWSWKIESILDVADETQKSGDDYPVRVYVVISDGFFFWQMRALNYVWASEQDKGSRWTNAFTERATMLAVESGDARVGEWVEVKRNVRDDIKNILGIDASRINAVAIMTDTDNSKQSVSAYYGDIFFTAE